MIGHGDRCICRRTNRTIGSEELRGAWASHAADPFTVNVVVAGQGCTQKRWSTRDEVEDSESSCSEDKRKRILRYRAAILIDVGV
jgi:hypothetical protein